MRKYLQRVLTCLVLCAMLAGSLAAPASAAGFQDVPANHWAAGSIQRCVEKGFFNGQSATRFGLGQQMSRSAFVVVLCRFLGWETTTPTAVTYPDVPIDVWYAGAVEAAYEHGAITDQRNVFRPNDPITREELAVMLVRALGYGEIAGLAQDLPVPFEDLTTNIGYITMAYDLGLVSGTTETTFSPSKTATREQVAVILMRLYDQLHTEKMEKIGIVSAESDMTGLDIAAIPAVRAFSLAIKENMDAQLVSSVQGAARAAGAKAFLYMPAGTAALGSRPEQMGAMIADTVKAGGYDGLILDIPEVTSKKSATLVKLVKEVNKNLGDKTFYLAVESPTRVGKAYDGYDYEKLAAAVDKFVLRIADYEQGSETFVTAPADPLEDVHYALASMKELVGADNLVLLLEVEMESWVKGHGSALSQVGLEALLAAETTKVYYSDRYASAYLVGQDDKENPLTAWFLDQKSVEARVQLAKGLGVKQICVSDWDAASDAVLAGLA